MCIIKIIDKVIVLNIKDSVLVVKLVIAPSPAKTILKCSAIYSIGGISVDSHNVNIQVMF